MPRTPATYATIDGMQPPIPLRHSVSFRRNGACNNCGRGSHTVPTWESPGAWESKMRRAYLMLALAYICGSVIPRSYFPARARVLTPPAPGSPRVHQVLRFLLDF